MPIYNFVLFLKSFNANPNAVKNAILWSERKSKKEKKKAKPKIFKKMNNSDEIIEVSDDDS